MWKFFAFSAVAALPGLVGGQAGWPMVRSATRAEIDAELPASMKAVDPPNPGAEARYRRFVQIASRIKGSGLMPVEPFGPAKNLAELRAAARVNRAVIADLDRISKEGQFRF